MSKASLKFWKHPSILLAILGMLVAFSVHFLEIQMVPLGNELHQTADDASYLRPAENLIDHGVWKDNSIGPSSYVQRPPIVGIIHLIGIVVFQTRSVWFIFLAALLAHGIGTSLLYKIILQFSNKRNALIFSTIFILSPCFWGFLSYSISEAFLVSSIIITSYIALTPDKLQLKRLVLSLVILYLMRPVLILIFIPTLISLCKKRFQDKKQIQLWSKSALLLNCSLLLSLIFLTSWEARKWSYTGSISPHPIYHSENETIFREPHSQLTELFKIWEVQPEVFHAITGRTWNNTLSDLNDIKRYTTTKSAPIKQEKLLSLLLKFNRLNEYDVKFFGKDGRAVRERRYATSVETTKQQIISENRLQYWINTPFLSAKENVFKSHLNLTLFQETFRGNPVMEILRSAILALLLLSYLALLLVPLALKNRSLSLICIGSMFYFLFLIGYQRMNEDRYFLPVVVVGFICLSILTFHYSEYFTKRRKPRP